MNKFKYGPLVYITVEDTDEEGNFYWGGKPPIGYDELGIPIDSDGMQCLSVSSPLHPNYKPKNSIYNKNINDNLPSIEEVKIWFDDLFLIVSDYQVKKYILRWYSLKRDSEKSQSYKNLLSEGLTIKEMIERIWQDEVIS